MPASGTDRAVIQTTSITLPSANTAAPSAPSTSAPIDLGSINTGDIVGFELIEADLDSESLVLAVADSSSLRARGLMGVTDFGEVDGMLFTWGGESVTSSFTMRNTLVPLTVVFFDAAGHAVDVLDMVPCDAEPCGSYSAQVPYAHAVEFPEGRAVPIDAILRIDQD